MRMQIGARFVRKLLYYIFIFKHHQYINGTILLTRAHRMAVSFAPGTRSSYAYVDWRNSCLRELGLRMHMRARARMYSAENQCMRGAAPDVVSLLSRRSA